MTAPFHFEHSASWVPATARFPGDGNAQTDIDRASSTGNYAGRRIEGYHAAMDQPAWINMEHQLALRCQ